jgi:hypothetical protein
MLGKRDVTVKVAVLLIACVVFATLLTLDAGTLLIRALGIPVVRHPYWRSELL